MSGRQADKRRYVVAPVGVLEAERRINAADEQAWARAEAERGGGSDAKTGSWALIGSEHRQAQKRRRAAGDCSRRALLVKRAHRRRRCRVASLNGAEKGRAHTPTRPHALSPRLSETLQAPSVYRQSPPPLLSCP
jgi:hypothetical protein